MVHPSACHIGRCSLRSPWGCRRGLSLAKPRQQQPAAPLLPAGSSPGQPQPGLPPSRAGSSPVELRFNEFLPKLEVSKGWIQRKGLMAKDGPLQCWVQGSNHCSSSDFPRWG